MNILDLDDDLIEYQPREESETSVVFYLEPRYRLENCPKCKVGKLNRNGYARDRQIRDMNFTGKFVELNIRAPRYQCSSCQKTTTHPFESIHDSHAMTERLVEDIQKKTLTNSYVKISREYGYRDTGTIQRIGNTYLEELNKLDVKTPKSLAILVIKMKDEFRLFFVDLETYDAGPSLIGIQKKVSHNELVKFIDRIDTDEIYLVLTEPQLKLNRWVRFNINNINVVNYGPSALKKNEKVYRDIFAEIARGTTYYLSPKELNSPQNKETLALLAKKEIEFAPYYTFYQENLNSNRKVRGFYRKLATAYCVGREDKSLSLFYDYFNEMVRLKNEITAYDAYSSEWDSLYNDINKVINHYEKQGKGYSYDALRNRLLFGTTATEYPVFERPSRERLKMYLRFGMPLPLEVGFHVPIAELLREISTN